VLLLTELHQLVGQSQMPPLFSCVRCQLERDTGTPLQLNRGCGVCKAKGRLASCPGAKRDPVTGNTTAHSLTCFAEVKGGKVYSKCLHKQCK